MLPRQTFIVRVHEPGRVLILEDVATGEHVQLRDLDCVGVALRRWLERGDGGEPEVAADRDGGRKGPS